MVEVEPSGPMREEDAARREPLLGGGEGVLEAWTDGAALQPAIRKLSRAGWGLWILGLPGGEATWRGADGSSWRRWRLWFPSCALAVRLQLLRRLRRWRLLPRGSQ